MCNPKLDTLLNGMRTPPDSDDDDFEREIDTDFIYETLSDDGLIPIEESVQIENDDEDEMEPPRLIR